MTLIFVRSTTPPPLLRRWCSGKGFQGAHLSLMVLVVVSIVYIATGATCVIIVHLYDSIVRVLVFTLAGGGGCPDCPSTIYQCIVVGQD